MDEQCKVILAEGDKLIRCSGVLFSKGMCASCYMQKRRTGSTKRNNIVNKGKTCIHEGCNNKAVIKLYCRHHYYKEYE